MLDGEHIRMQTKEMKMNFMHSHAAKKQSCIEDEISEALGNDPIVQGTTKLMAHMIG